MLRLAGWISRATAFLQELKGVLLFASFCVVSQGFPVTCIVGNWAPATDLAELGPVTCFLSNQRRGGNWFLFESLCAVA